MNMPGLRLRRENEHHQALREAQYMNGSTPKNSNSHIKSRSTVLRWTQLTVFLLCGRYNNFEISL